jgi:TniQ
MNARWGIMVPLLPNELFSSWLARAALTQGCDPLVLAGDVWPTWRVWTIDLDRGIAPNRLEHLAKVSGIEKLSFETAMLRPTAQLITADICERVAVWPWTLALGSRNRKRHGGLQYCPVCLSLDAKPHFRLQWRCAWYLGCALHGCALRDNCPHCYTPIEPHRLTAMDRHMAICASCKGDLRTANVVDAPFEALAFQEAADQVLAKREGFYGTAHLTPSE